MSEKNAATVSQVNKRIGDIIADDGLLTGLAVKGEISDFKLHRPSGHIYFTLKDKKSSLKCVMFKEYAGGMKFLPQDGTQVVATGDVRVYERGGTYQLYAFSVIPDGTGVLYEQFEQLKTKLIEEGLFSRKRKLPGMPRKIAVITAPDAAAFRDMASVLERRFPIAEILLIPALVQGINAPQSIVRALKTAQNTDADVIILGRGGGSAEDLWSFNDENVARAVFASKIPTISAVGHETDFTLTDFTADLRAPTPSAAAEIAAPDINSVRNYVNELSAELRKKAGRKINAAETRLAAKSLEISAKSPAGKITAAAEKLAAFEDKIKRGLKALYDGKFYACNRLAAVITALSPQSVLARGYAVAEKQGGEAVRGSNEVSYGEILSLRFYDSRLYVIAAPNSE